MMRLPASVAILGKGLDLTYTSADGKVLRTDLKGMAVCGDLDRETVWIWPMPARDSAKSLDQVNIAARLRKAWSALEPDRVLAGKPKVGAKTARLGHVRTIGYRSDKWSGTNTDYEHKYDSEPVLSHSGNVYRISGGKQRVTPDGITG